MLVPFDVFKSRRGHLIVGYNEATLGQTRLGSHNLIVGKEHEYTSYGGLVAGEHNTVSGPFASVSGGGVNTASGVGAAVSGGNANTASGQNASVSGGGVNTASGQNAAVSGGQCNSAGAGPVPACSQDMSDPAEGAAVAGGYFNLASGVSASVSGGNSNNAGGTDATVGGGSSLGAFIAGTWHAEQSAGFPTGGHY